MAGAGRIVVRVDPDLADMIPGFIANRHRDLELLRAAAASGDLEAIRQVGHRLLGVGGGYGFQEISAIGARIEAAAKEGRQAAAVAAIDELADHLSRLEVDTAGPI